ncbi:hypothetical protein HanOQP8_Chr06g0233441 [Helianthus annuus]|nr:hypothetical protein HanOQP8_Chr06g0233441 [Helianthus annuus]
MIGGSFGVAPVVDATVVTARPLEPLVVPSTATVEPTSEIPPPVISESSIPQSGSRVSTAPLIVYTRRRKRT